MGDAERLRQIPGAGDRGPLPPCKRVIGSFKDGVEQPSLRNQGRLFAITLSEQIAHKQVDFQDALLVLNAWASQSAGHKHAAAFQFARFYGVVTTQEEKKDLDKFLTSLSQDIKLKEKENRDAFAAGIFALNPNFIPLNHVHSVSVTPDSGSIPDTKDNNLFAGNNVMGLPSAQEKPASSQTTDASLQSQSNSGLLDSFFQAIRSTLDWTYQALFDVLHLSKFPPEKPDISPSAYPPLSGSFAQAASDISISVRPTFREEQEPFDVSKTDDYSVFSPPIEQLDLVSSQPERIHLPPSVLPADSFPSFNSSLSDEKIPSTPGHIPVRGETTVISLAEKDSISSLSVPLVPQLQNRIIPLDTAFMPSLRSLVNHSNRSNTSSKKLFFASDSSASQTIARGEVDVHVVDSSLSSRPSIPRHSLSQPRAVQRFHKDDKHKDKKTGKKDKKEKVGEKAKAAEKKVQSSQQSSQFSQRNIVSRSFLFPSQPQRSKTKKSARPKLLEGEVQDKNKARKSLLKRDERITKSVVAGRDQQQRDSREKAKQALRERIKFILEKRKSKKAGNK